MAEAKRGSGGPPRRRPAAARKADARRVELELERGRTEARLSGLAAQRGELEESIRAIDAATHQLIGRLRLVREMLGEVEPMAEAPAPPPAPEADEPEE